MSLLFDRLKDKLEVHTGKVRLSTQSPCIQGIQEEISSKLHIKGMDSFLFLFFVCVSLAVSSPSLFASFQGRCARRGETGGASHE